MLLKVTLYYCLIQFFNMVHQMPSLKFIFLLGLLWMVLYDIFFYIRFVYIFFIVRRVKPSSVTDNLRWKGVYYTIVTLKKKIAIQFLSLEPHKIIVEKC